MRLIKGGRSTDGSNVRSVDFAGASRSLFYAKAFFELPFPGFVVEAGGEFSIVDVNRRAVGLLGVSAMKIVGRPFKDVFHLSSPIAALVDVWQEGQNSGQALTLSLAEAPSPPNTTDMELVGVSQLEDGGKHYLIVMLRASKIKTGSEAEPARQLVDGATGLPNTLAAERKLELLCSSLTHRSKDLVVALFSVESQGCEADGQNPGVPEMAIGVIANRLKTYSAEGVFISRYRRNEFMVVLHGRKDFRDVLERVYEALTSEFLVGGKPCFFSVKAGVHMRNVWDSMQAEELLAKARKAAQQAKLEGGNTFVVYRRGIQHSEANAIECDQIVDSFRKGEFKLHFQPVISFRTGRVEFAEGLLRWAHPKKGEQRPLKFLEYIVNTPVYDEVGLWVLDLALSTLEGWIERGLDVGLCINIGAAQLASPVFQERATRVFTNYSAATRNRLSIDIVNLDNLEDIPALINGMKRLGQGGVRFAIDDFGTGDTRILGAMPLPVDSIKLGQGYVSSLQDDLGSVFIVQNIIEYALQNEIDVYAKGVETAEQYSLLEALGCAGAQGFAISKPLAGEDFITYINEYEPDLAPASLSSVNGAGEGDVFSFALTEHKALLKEMLSQTISMQEPPIQRISELEALLKAMGELEEKIEVSGERKAQLAHLRASVRCLLDGIAVQGHSADVGAHSFDAREAMRLLTQLVNLVNEIAG